jgi:EAL and modified HD-GYP domain-containing signal transduction protein
VGRQPIFDKEGVCFGYELLYRSCEANNVATFQDNAKASARVIVNLIHNIGLTPIIGHKRGYINVDESILFSDAILLLPKEHFSFEILEHTKVSLALYERVKHLHSLGYRFSLDDFDCSDTMIKYYEPLFPYIDIIKVDIQAIGIPQLQTSIDKLQKYTIPLLAEKIYFLLWDYCIACTGCSLC